MRRMLHNPPHQFRYAAPPGNPQFEIEIAVLRDDIDLLAPGNNARVKCHPFEDLATLFDPELLRKDL